MIAKFEQGPVDELVLRCNCGANHFLVFTYWRFDDEDPDTYVDIVEEWRRPRGLVGRLTACWQLFWKGEYHTASAGLEAEDLKRIISWCRARLDGITPSEVLGMRGED